MPSSTEFRISIAAIQTVYLCKACINIRFVLTHLAQLCKARHIPCKVCTAQLCSILRVILIHPVERWIIRCRIRSSCWVYRLDILPVIASVCVAGKGCRLGCTTSCCTRCADNAFKLRVVAGTAILCPGMKGAAACMQRNTESRPIFIRASDNRDGRIA